MTALAIQPISFSFHETHDVRIQVIDGEPWFCLKDVCDVLTIANPRRVAAEILDAKGVRKTDALTDGGKQQLTFVNEPNLYRVIFRSNKPEAKQFQDWVFNEVLPSIRKTGRYEHTVCNPTRQTRDPLSQNDLQNLNWLVQGMVRTMRYQGVWSRAIWHTLRRATGVPSPEPFGVSDLPVLVQECRRIIEITGLVNVKVSRFEREAARRILRNREDCQQVLRQLESELENCGLDDRSIRTLEKHEQMALTQLERRLVN